MLFSGSDDWYRSRSGTPLLMPPVSRPWSYDWYRSRSGTLVFYATLEEISQIVLSFFENLKNGLNIDEFYICGADAIQIVETGYYRHVPFSYNLDQILYCMKNHETPHFYIGHESITSRNEVMMIDADADADGTLTLSGLVNICFFKTPFSNGDLRIPIFCTSRLMVVHRIIKMQTREPHEHIEYFNLFKKLKREFKKHLPYKTKWRGGSQVDKSCFMSEGAVALYKSGVVFEHEPLLN